MLKTFGGWPVLEQNWDESNFDWYASKYEITNVTEL